METTQTTKPNKFKVFCNSIYEGLKQDVRTKNSDFNRIMLKCGILIFTLLISLFVDWFIYITLFLGFLFVFFQFNARSIYYLVALYPFMHIFRAQPQGFYLYTILLLVVVAELGIKFLLELFKKKKKIDWKFTIPMAALLLFGFIVSDFSKIDRIASFVMAIAFVYVVYIYRSELSFKEIALIYCIALVFAMAMGCLRPISERLQIFVANHFHNGLLRYSACHSNPNVISVELTFGIATILALFVNKDIKLIFYPIFGVLLCAQIASLSKAGGLVLLVSLIYFLIAYLIKNHKKEDFLYYGGAILTILIVCLIMNNYVASLMGRLSVITQNVNETVNENGEIIVEELTKEEVLSNFTTGRLDIWKCYWQAITKSAKSLLFGYGLCENEIIGLFNGQLFSSHSTYLQCLYKIGFIGFLIVVVCIATAFNWKKFKNISWHSLIPVFALAIIVGSEGYFGFRLSVLIAIASFCIFKEEKEYKIQTLEEPVIIIPKKIHYIWLGGKPLPEIAKKCIATWQKHCPDYEIKQWDESNLNIDICPYCRQAYDAKKFAFASDVLRFDVINREGGVYLDIDVELYSSLDKFLGNQFFTAFESDIMVNPGLIMGGGKGNKHIKNILDSYKKDNFVNEDGSLNTQNTVCVRTTKYLEECGIKMDNSLQKTEEITVYPTEYFCPKSPVTNQINKTENTVAMHLYYASWISTKAKIKKAIKYVLNFFTNGYFGIVLNKYKGKLK